jgi:hypothetical protein
VTGARHLDFPLDIVQDLGALARLRGWLYHERFGGNGIIATTQPEKYPMGHVRIGNRDRGGIGLRFARKRQFMKVHAKTLDPSFQRSAFGSRRI